MKKRKVSSWGRRIRWSREESAPCTVSEVVSFGTLCDEEPQVRAVLEIDVFHDDVAIESFEHGVDPFGGNVEPNAVVVKESPHVCQDAPLQREDERVHRVARGRTRALIGDLPLQPVEGVVTAHRQDRAVVEDQDPN